VRLVLLMTGGFIRHPIGGQGGKAATGCSKIEAISLTNIALKLKRFQIL
jgi:hypothetical protein